MKLSDEDGRAVDMLLDRPATKGNGNGNGDENDGSSYPTVAAESQVQVHIAAATDVLQLLDSLEVPEPPADLVQRTLRKIDEIAARGHVNVPAGAGTTTAAPESPQQPQA